MFIAVSAGLSFLNSLGYLLWPRQRIPIEFGNLSYLATILIMPFGIIATVSFLLWFFRAYKNVTLLPAEGRRFSPNWTLVGYLVPPLSLVVPFLIMREIWKASTPGLRSDDAFAWRHTAVAPLLTAWWAVYIAGDVILMAAAMGPGVWKTLYRGRIISQTLPVEKFAWLMALGGLLFIIASVLKIRIMKRVDGRQSARYLELYPATHGDDRV